MIKKWFEGSSLIECSFQSLEHAIMNHGKFYEGVVSFMSGISSVEILEQGSDYLTIRTNEGIMKRTKIRKSIAQDIISIDFDEEYKAGKMITTNAHFFDEFTSTKNGIKHSTTISDVKAPGVLGFFYRVFGSNNIGKAVLSSHKIYLESLKVSDNYS